MERRFLLGSKLRDASLISPYPFHLECELYYITEFQFRVNQFTASNELGAVQASHFTCAETSTNEREQDIFFIRIKFGTYEMRRLNRAY